MSKNEMRKWEKGVLAGLFAISAAGAGFMSYGLSDPEEAKRIIEADGRFASAEHLGHNVFGCGRGDLWRDEFKAVNKEGRPVEIVVCRGIAKESTIRIK